MKINNLKTLSLSVLLASATACTHKSFKPMPQEYIPCGIKESVDSFSKESQNILKDTSYKCYGYDTVKITPKDVRSISDFGKKLDSKAKEKDKSVITKSYTVMEPVFFNNKMHLYPQVKHKYEKEHMEQKGIIKDVTFLTTDSTDIYIPVEYYGKDNPNVKKKDKN